MYKNIAKQEKINLKDQVEYQSGQVVSKTLVQNDLVSMTIFSFDKGEEISTHAASGDAMVTVLEGRADLQSAAKFSTSKRAKLLLCQRISHTLFTAKNASRCSLSFPTKHYAKPITAQSELCAVIFIL